MSTLFTSYFKEILFMKSIGLYIHIPFCQNKCPYCDFYSVKYDDVLIDSYIDKLIQEIRLWSKKVSVSIDTVYLGGGTPGIIGTKRIIKIIDTIKSCFKLENPEITIEINPLNHEFLDFESMFSEGINRISIGAQSAKDNELVLLGRNHKHNDTIYTVEKAKNAGFKNISLDLMIATQKQTLESLKYSIEQYVSLDVTHISCYLLKIEENTPYFQKRSSLLLPTEDEEYDLYTSTCKMLESLGLKQYEISNFSKEGYESKHNLKYWNCEEYIGIGPSAHSFLNGKRFYYPKSIDKFLNDTTTISDGTGGGEEEYIMLKLRLSKGLLHKEYQERFGSPIPDRYIQNAKKYQNTGLLISDSLGIRLTYLGFLVSNRIILDIIR